MNNYRRLEQRSIYISIATTLSMSIFGIGFGIWIQSDAVMLDGFFNLVNFLMASASLWIIWLTQKQENKVFNFGYAGFVPLLNLCKGLLVFGVSIFAFTGAVGALFHGGRPANTGIAVVYAIIAATVALIVAFIQRTLAKKTNSPIVNVDAKNWFINGMISVAVGISFSIATFLQTTRFDWLVPYADPTIVTVLVLIAFPIPVTIIITSLKQLMLGSASPEIRNDVKALIEEGISSLPWQRYAIRITEVGNSLYLHFYWLLPADDAPVTLMDVDKMRSHFNQILMEKYPNMTIDIIFTQDEPWFMTMNDQRGVESIAKIS
ncbi:cation diffusion facilitator family transporter [Cyanobacterium stanieri PCC 7202]|uniref:Cation diffusion facilitator family transporter n=1 Tax=Cyanobacterium stanieri (strain ATCC 29140 / PCC 7202) TaxID=292563 RepID=K9YLD9_CYASC|nr:cation diffusion facilitator family transporter [Cyanobacterium stanieri PCC 7202]